MNRTAFIFFAATVGLFFSLQPTFSKTVIDERKEPQYLFVITAMSGISDGDKLTLRGVPSVLYFSDRPSRLVGHMSPKKFVENWMKSREGLIKDPPNAVLSILDAKETKNTIIELVVPHLMKGDLTFTIKVIKGSIPRSFGPASLFIDDEGLPEYGSIGIVP